MIRHNNLNSSLLTLLGLAWFQLNSRQVTKTILPFLAVYNILIQGQRFSECSQSPSDKDIWLRTENDFKFVYFKGRLMTKLGVNLKIVKNVSKLNDKEQWPHDFIE